MSDRSGSGSQTPVDNNHGGPGPMPDAGPRHAPAPVPNPNQIEIKVQAESGSALHFKIKKSTQMVKVMDAWCAKEGAGEDTLRFLFDGQRILKTDTPGSVSYLFLRTLSFSFLIFSSWHG